MFNSPWHHALSTEPGGPYAQGNLSLLPVTYLPHPIMLCLPLFSPILPIISVTVQDSIWIALGTFGHARTRLDTIKNLPKKLSAETFSAFAPPQNFPDPPCSASVQVCSTLFKIEKPSRKRGANVPNP